MTLVVSDTSAISALLQIGQAGILEDLYEKILIPPAVECELLRAYRNIPAFVRVHAVTETPVLQDRRSILDEGEACAITLAEQVAADLLLIDEKKGRAVAEQAGLRYIGLVGVLIEAKRREVVPVLRPILERLVEDAGFRLAQPLYTAVLRTVGEDGPW